MTWEDEYRQKTIPAEEAANLVRSGDHVVFPTGRPPSAFGFALVARKDELRDVKILEASPAYDFGWFDPGMEDSFSIITRAPTAVSADMVRERRCDLLIGGMYISQDTPYLVLPDDAEPDIVVVQISAPDKHGFCSFGASLWDKKDWVRRGKIAIGEVNDRLIRTYGENFVHVSEFDYFVDHLSLGGEPGGVGSLGGRATKEPPGYCRALAGYLNELVRDGDTLQMGISRNLESLIHLGMLEGKHDLGWHSEATIPGVIRLVREGVINGSRKTVNKGVLVTTAIGGDTRKELEWAAENPMIWLMPCGYVWDVRVIGAHDNFTAINAAAMVDLSGQITTEWIGGQMVGSPGGQIPFSIGAWLSRGGRVIHAMSSTVETRDGVESRIRAQFPAGSSVTLHRQAAQYVVTEHGIANLTNKTYRQRAMELIAVAHPDYRAELKKAATELYWP